MVRAVGAQVGSCMVTRGQKQLQLSVMRSILNNRYPKNPFAADASTRLFHRDRSTLHLPTQMKAYLHGPCFSDTPLIAIKNEVFVLENYSNDIFPHNHSTFDICLQLIGQDPTIVIRASDALGHYFEAPIIADDTICYYNGLRNEDNPMLPRLMTHDETLSFIDNIVDWTSNEQIAEGAIVVATQPLVPLPNLQVLAVLKANHNVSFEIHIGSETPSVSNYQPVMFSPRLEDLGSHADAYDIINTCFSNQRSFSPRNYQQMHSGSGISDKVSNTPMVSSLPQNGTPQEYTTPIRIVMLPEGQAPPSSNTERSENVINNRVHSNNTSNDQISNVSMVSQPQIAKAFTLETAGVPSPPSEGKTHKETAFTPLLTVVQPPLGPSSESNGNKRLSSDSTPHKQVSFVAMRNNPYSLQMFAVESGGAPCPPSQIGTQKESAFDPLPTVQASLGSSTESEAGIQRLYVDSTPSKQVPNTAVIGLHISLEKSMIESGEVPRPPSDSGAQKAANNLSGKVVQQGGLHVATGSEIGSQASPLKKRVAQETTPHHQGVAGICEAPTKRLRVQDFMEPDVSISGVAAGSVIACEGGSSDVAEDSDGGDEGGDSDGGGSESAQYPRKKREKLRG